MTVLCLVLAASIAQPEAPAPSAPPDGLLDAVGDYVEGVLDGDAERVQEAAHEQLAKRRVAHEYWGQPSTEWLRGITREQIPGLVEYFQNSGAVSPADPDPTYEILTWTKETASVKAESGAGLQLLHLARFEDEWQVVDDAYDLDPLESDRSEERGVRIVVTNYARGIYERSAIKALGSCHTSLAKREVVEAEQGVMLKAMSYEEVGLYASAFNAYWEFKPSNAKRDIEVLAIVDSIAAVRLDGENWTDLIHVAKLNGSWLIVDVLTIAGEHERPVIEPTGE